MHTVDRCTVLVGPHEPERTARVVGDRLRPRPVDEPSGHGAAVEARLDRSAERDLAAHLTGRKAQRQRARVGAHLRAHLHELATRLVVDEAAVGIDEVEAAVGGDAVAPEHDLLGMHEPESLDGRDREPRDLHAPILRVHGTGADPRARP